MKNFKSIFIIASFLVAVTCLNASAQMKAQKTSSARAAYGLAPEPSKHKAKKKHKARKGQQYQSPKNRQSNAKGKNPAYRKKNNWAS